MTDVDMQSLLTTQRQAFLDDGFPSAKTRIDRLDRVKDIHIRYKDKIVEALEADFGSRPRGQSLATDVASIIMEVKETRGKIRQWMKPQRRKTPLMLRLTGGRAELQFQPLGVVGNISPWNFPVELAFSPAIGALAAGNRVMLKPAEATPQCSALIEEMVSSAFDPAEMAVVTGGVEVAQAFSQLPFDHLVFTGGPEIARHVMRAASDNLVPLTLELGGKCPVVVGQSADVKTVADRVISTKTINSGQLCLTPDYIFLPEGKVEAFIEEARKVLASCYDSLVDNPDYTSVINERHWQRLKGYIDDLEERKVRVEVFNPAGESFDDPQKHKLPFIFPVEPDDEALIMQNEIFGPMLSIKTYRSLDKVVEFINDKPRPLALYYFGKDRQEIDALCQRTTSGGVTINDCAQHAACYDLPLAGVGNSGMGGYHGHHGFLQFSHSKAVYHQGLFSLGKFLRPPYTPRKIKIIDSMV
ncbi:MAG: coniferyl aldehyde dehydrogenase [Proteobacteria bacterium]|nr:coniferyl aldehyde dehydrogenase [Pseudomonadota bacterium]